MTAAKKLARALMDNEREGKSSLPMLKFLVRTDRVPAGVTITFIDGRAVVDFGNTETGIV